jgi:hypothetical protein
VEGKEDKTAATITATKLIIEQQQEKENFDDTHPLKPFLFALKSLESKRQYPKRLKVFFDYGLDKKLSLDEQAKIFIEKFNNNNENGRGIGEKWAAQYFMNFIEYQNDRVRTNEISP